MLSTFDRRVRKLLVNRDLATAEEIDQVVENGGREIGEDGTSLSEALIDEGLVEPEDLVSKIASEMNVPPVNLERVQPNEEALEAIDEEMANYYEIVPISKIGNLLTIAVANPFDLQKLDDIRLATDCDLRTMVSTDRAIREAIDRIYSEDGMDDEMMEHLLDDEEGNLEYEEEEEGEEEIDLSEITGDASDSKVVQLVNTIIKRGLDKGVSDIHIEPEEDYIRVRFRKDGVLSTELNPPKRMHGAMVSRIKIMSQMDIAERRAPQDGKFKMKYEGRKIDFRVSVLPTVNGEKVVMRILDPSGLALDLEDLGFEPQALEHFRKSINEPWGMILVTGPTGSGKSTTLYSALQELQSPEENITTVEDPVEYELEGIVQVQVQEEAGLTFAGSLRSILRQDPDIVLVGEIRDLETADIAIKAALTGHLVMSTLHTNDAPSAIARLTDMGVDEVMVASSLNLVSAQRLLRELCDHCKEPKDEMPDRDYLLNLGFQEEELDDDPVFYEAKGCSRCMEGYDGRFAILETMYLDDDVRKMISQGATSHDLKEYAIEELDMMTLRRCGLVNAMKGRTSLEETLRVTMAD